MKTLLASIAAAALTTAAASATTIIVDNYFTEQNGDTGGAVGDFAVQSFTPTVAGDGVNDTVTANSPLPGTVYLESVSFLRAVSGTNNTADATFINVYLGSGSGGTFLGSSSNSIIVRDAAGLDVLTWDFGGLELADSTQEYAFVFSSTNVEGDNHQARFQVARDSGGGFGNSYDGGTADDTSTNASPLAFETRFQVTLNTVPEPSSAALLGLGGLAMILRRRK